MRRPHAALGAVLTLLLSVTLTACGSDGSEPGAAPPSTSPTTTASGQSEAEALDAAAAQSGFAMGADVASFCTAMQDADDAVDGARPGNAGDWKRVVAALDRIYEVGVPEDFPAAALTELDVLDRLVRASSSIDDLGAAVEKEPAGTGAIDAYLTEACTA